jgi:hypothetical protein
MLTTRIVVITVEGKTRIPWTQARKRCHFRELPTERLPRYFHRQNKYYFRRNDSTEIVSRLMVLTSTEITLTSHEIILFIHIIIFLLLINLRKFKKKL